MPSPAFEQRLQVLRATGAFAPDLVDRFAAFIETAPEEELYRTSPLRHAAAWGLDERTTIDLFLHATHAGILDFSWGVLCPMCVAFLTTAAGLRSLGPGRRCGLCRIDVSGSLDDNVEVAFTVAPAVRRVRFHDPEKLDLRAEGLGLFFSRSVAPGSPIHATLQANALWAGHVARGAVGDAAVTLPPGRWALVAPASHSVLHLEAGAGPAELAVDVLDGQTIPERAPVSAGPVTLRLRNRTSREAGMLIVPDPIPPPEERPPDLRPPMHDLLPYLSGKRLITTQTFRDLFRAESIPSEGGLELKSLTVLFTDLQSSTAMYERIGDLRAYDLVRKHFGALRRIVAAEGGAVVKTIGDAIMASFAEAGGAMASAVAMHREIAGVAAELALKIGLHAGPCIAVDLNDRLDYFGRTVNIAARVQSLAAAGETICTDAVYTAPGVADLCRAAGLRPRRSEASLKGIGAAVPVIRLQPD